MPLPPNIDTPFAYQDGNDLVCRVTVTWPTFLDYTQFAYAYTVPGNVNIASTSIYGVMMNGTIYFRMQPPIPGRYKVQLFLTGHMGDTEETFQVYPFSNEVQLDAPAEPPPPSPPPPSPPPPPSFHATVGMMGKN